VQDTAYESSNISELNTDDEEVLEEERSLGRNRKRKRAMRKRKMKRFQTMTWSIV